MKHVLGSVAIAAIGATAAYAEAVKPAEVVFDEDNAGGIAEMAELPP